MIISEVIDAIDNIDSITMESEINTCNSLLSSYDKMSLLMENYNGDDLNIFNIFQEGFIDDVKKDMKKSGEGESTLLKILTALPRLVMAIVRSLQKRFKKSNSKEVAKVIGKTIDSSEKKKNYVAKIGAVIAGAAVITGANKITKDKKQAAAEAAKIEAAAEAAKKAAEELEKRKQKNSADFKDYLDTVNALKHSIELYTDEADKFIKDDIPSLNALEKCKSVRDSLGICKQHISRNKTKLKSFTDDSSKNEGIEEQVDKSMAELDIEFDKLNARIDKSATALNDIIKTAENSAKYIRSTVSHGIVFRNDELYVKNTALFKYRDYVKKAIDVLRKFSTTNDMSDDELKFMKGDNDLEQFPFSRISDKFNLMTLSEALDEYNRIEEVFDEFKTVAELYTKCSERLKSLETQRRNAVDDDQKQKISKECTEFANIWNSSYNQLIKNPRAEMCQYVNALAGFEKLINALSYYLDDVQYLTMNKHNADYEKLPKQDKFVNAATWKYNIPFDD